MNSLFDFAAQVGQHRIERIEVHCQYFTRLRHSVRRVITNLNDADNPTAKEYADQLRSIMSTWLTSPSAFDDSLARIFVDMGPLVTIRRQWGNVIHDAVSDAIESLNVLQANSNHLRITVAKQITTLVSDKVDFRIYCHPRSRVYFESILTECNLEQPYDELFICSVASYRNLEPFDVLIKVGPFRSKGWGAAPDAIISAPRSRSILQILWSGLKDEEGFGYDPIFRGGNQSIGQFYEPSNSAPWISQLTTVGESDPTDCQYLEPVDDFAVYLQPRQEDDCHRAVLIQVDTDYGVLVPPLSKVLSFNKDLDIEQRVVSESLELGMFIVFPELYGNKNDCQQVGDGILSKYWRTRLSERYANGSDDLVDKLRSSGIKLASLHSCIQNWCREPTTVIHAPMQKEHFKILVDELSCDFHDQERRPFQWWEYAWQEVRRSRGMAIQHGHDTQQVIDQLLLAGLNMMQSDICPKISEDKFTVPIPRIIDGVDIEGQYRCFRIMSIEVGFRAPDRELRTLVELERIDLWRE